MKAEYQAWIEAALAGGNGYGECKKVTQEMSEVFPELKRVSGFYYDMSWGRRQHFWMITPDGTVVDPTAAQFPSLGRGHYEEITDPSLIPTGVCMDCGQDVYNGNTFCDAECEAATRAYLGI